MNRQLKSIIFLLSFLFIVLIISKGVGYYVDEKMYDIEIDFTVSRIEVTPALRCRFFDSAGKELKANGYTFYNHSRIKEGDKIIKKAHSKELIVYRKDASGVYKHFLIVSR